MSKLMSLIRRAPKRFSAIVIMIAAAIIVPLAVNAWGPDRPTFTGKNPAPYVTFNSITDNPQVGDERNFVRIKESGTSTYGDNVNLTPGKVYDVSVYYHNNASSSLNASGKGIAHGTTLKMEVPGVVKAGVNAVFTGTVSASNANPGSVWDEAYGKNTTNGDVLLRYVTNSATVVSNGAVNGKKLPDTLFSTGTSLGYDALNGELPGCNEFAGYVNFQIRVDQPNFNVVKKVSVDGGTTWADTATAKPGAAVQYFISYQNTGTNQQDDVVIRDMLPTGVSYTANSTYILNSTTGGQFKKTIEGITTNGLNAGSYQPKGNVAYKFSATLPQEDALKCGLNELVNTARATTNAGYKEDTATVTVNKECKPPVAKYTCDALKVVTVDRTHFKFSTTYTAENATFTSATYVIKNAAGATVDTKTVNGSTNLDYTQTTPGKYTVQSTLTFTVDGATKTVTSTGCTGAFEVPKLPENPGVSIEKTVNGKKAVQVAVNAPFTYELKVKNTGDVDLANVKVTDPAPANVEFIKASVGTIANNAWSYTIPSLKVGETKSFTITAKVTKEVSGAIKNTACVDAPAVPGNPDDCDTATVTVPPVGEITVCELATKQIITIKETAFDNSKYSKNLDDCATIPTTPPELPHTGIGENIVAIVGLGALIASLGYYIASRRALS